MGRPIERSTRPHRQGGGGSRSRGAASTDDNEAYGGLCKLYGVEQFRSSTERKSGKKRHTANALAFRGEEGRGKLRKAMGSGRQAENHGCPNGATRREKSRHPEREAIPGELKHLSNRRKRNQPRTPE